jgi:hypothetical protein
VLEETNNLMVPVRNDVWFKLITEKTKNVEEIEVASDTLLSGQVSAYLTEFCTGRSQARGRDEILMGRPWTEGGVTYFMPSSFLEFITSRRLGYTRQRLSLVLTDLGVQEHEDTIKGKPTLYWSVAERKGQTEPHEVPQSADGAPF